MGAVFPGMRLAAAYKSPFAFNAKLESHQISAQGLTP